MKTIHKKEKLHSNVSLTREEFVEQINLGEKGPFISGGKLKIKMNKWIKESEKK